MEKSEALGSAEPPGEPPQSGDQAYAGLIRYEWRAHRALWLGAAGVIFAASIAASLLSGRAPLWAALIEGVCNGVLVVSALALLGLALAWRHLRAAEQTLQFEQRRAFTDAAGGALLRRVGVVALAVMAAEALIWLLPT